MAQSDLYATKRTTNPATITPTESHIMAAVGDWLTLTLPAGWAVVQGQQNRSAPAAPPLAVMQIITRQRLATNSHEHDDTSTHITQSLKMGLQVTLFGTGAGDGVVQLNTSWRDESAVAYFQKRLAQMAPLYASNPRQHPFITAEKQYEDTWSLDLMLTVNTTITRPLESAEELSMSAIYMPENGRFLIESDT